ncbi:ABC transporter permease subunit [Halomontanus rarus]|uniref:ABC transporter permease subunit n=1 Tax=Halomontanus rarus TaxID=3034020 RepID=UPI001A993C32
MSADSALETITARVRSPFEGPNTTGNSNAFWTAFVLAVVGLFLVPAVSPGHVSDLTLFMSYAFLALSLCFIWGYCGILSFGQVAFFGVAGYTFGIVGINVGAETGALLGVVAALFVATLFAAALGYFMFYGGVRDVYVTIMTLVVALVLNTFMGQTAGSEWAIGDARLGGFNGMVGAPNRAIGTGSVAIDMTGDGLYYVVLALLIATYLGLRALVNSRFGYAMVATREDEDRTAMFGYNTKFIKLAVFTFGGTLAGLSGVLFMFWSPGGYINPDVFGITAAAMPVIWASIGGRTSLLGTTTAAVALQYLDQRLAASGSEYALVVIGALLLFVILVMPAGVAPYAERAVDWIRDGVSAKLRGDPESENENAPSNSEVTK